MNNISVEADRISKSYGDVKAIQHISFTVSKKELFGLIGPDGSGKTTIFRILTTLLFADSGKVTVEGFDVVRDFKNIRKISGYMPGKFSLYHDLTVEENLKFYATIFKTTVSENYDLIRDIYIQIEPFKKRKAGKLSGGMKQKLALCCALIHKPTILFLDEPTTGVDAVSRKEFWEMLKNLQDKGITIIVSTPYMDEAALCDKVALIQNGIILRIDTPDKIVEQYQHPLYQITSDHMYELPGHLKNYQETLSAYRFGDVIHIALKSEIKTGEIEKYLFNKGHQKIEYKQILPNIEDCFMALMKND